MSNAMVPASFQGQVSTKFAQAQAGNDLAGGVQAGFGVIGYKGKVWSIRYRGQEIQLLRDDGDGPRNSIEVVIIKSSNHLSKVWYEKGYQEGSNAAPDCFSTNGLTPDPQSAKRQSNTCANCPQNVWGSKVTDAGKKGKACADSKRLAIVPISDLENDTYGGPMLLRVPAASLGDLAQYGTKMHNLGYPYYAIATRISFNPQESYPKFQFAAIRPLSDDEADIILRHQASEAVTRILAEGSETAAAQQADNSAMAAAFEQPPAQAPAKPQPAPQSTPKTNGGGGFGPAKVVSSNETSGERMSSDETAQPKAQAKKAKAEPVEDAEVMVDETTKSGTSFEASLDDELEKLLNPTG